MRGQIVLDGVSRLACFGNAIDPETGHPTGAITLRGYVNGDGEAVVRVGPDGFAVAKMSDPQERRSVPIADLADTNATAGWYAGELAIRGEEFQDPHVLTAAIDVLRFFGMAQEPGSGEIRVDGRTYPAFYDRTLDPKTGSRGDKMVLRSYIDGHGRVHVRIPGGSCRPVSYDQERVQAEANQLGDAEIDSGWYYGDVRIDGKGFQTALAKEVAGSSLLFHGLVKPKGMGSVTVGELEHSAVFADVELRGERRTVLLSYQGENGAVMYTRAGENNQRP